MDFLVKIGNTGQFKSYPQIDSNQKMYVLQQKIEQDFSISIQDQILLTKKGIKVCSEDVILKIMNENLFQVTQQHNEDYNSIKNQLYSLYVFNTKQKPTQNQDIHEYISQNLDKIDDQYLLDNNYIHELTVTQKLSEHYLKIKDKLLEYIPKSKLLERVIQETDNQIQSFDVILKQASVNFTSTKLKKNEIVKKLKDLIDKNTNIINKYDEGMEIIKKFEIHQQLQNENQKYLIDVYFDTERMQQWKENCLESQQQLKLKSEKLVVFMKNLKKKIKEERNVTINNSYQQYKQQKVNYENLQENEGIVQSIFSNAYDNFREKNVLSEEEFRENLQKIEDQIQKVQQFLETIFRFKWSQQILIEQMHKLMEKHIYELKLLNNEKLKQFQEQLEKLDKDFTYLLNPSQLPNAYHKALTEISRRREFNNYINRIKQELSSNIEKESKHRQKFISQYGRILPSDFIPQFKQQVPKFSIQYDNNSNLDSKLPNIDGMHNKEYEILTNNSYISQVELEELQKLLINTHLYYKDNIVDNNNNHYHFYDILQKTTLFNYNQNKNKVKQIQQLTDENQYQVNYYENLIKIEKMESEEKYNYLKERLKEKDQEILKMRKQIEEINNEFNEKIIHQELKNKNEYSLEIEKLQQKLQSNEQIIRNKQQEIDKQQQIINQNIKDQKGYEDQMNFYQQNIEQQQMNIKNKELELNNIKNRKDNCELVIQQRNQEIEKQNKQIKELEKQNMDLITKTNQIQQEMQQQISKFQQQIQNNQNNQSSLQNTELIQIKEQYSHKCKEIQQIQLQIKDQQLLIDQQKQQIDSQQFQISQSNQQIQQLQIQLQQQQLSQQQQQQSQQQLNSIFFNKFQSFLFNQMQQILLNQLNKNISKIHQQTIIQKIEEMLEKFKKVNRKLENIKQQKLQKTQIKKQNMKNNNMIIQQQDTIYKEQEISDKHQIMINKLELDQNILFIPVSQGVYIPLIVSQNDSHNNSNILDNNNSETSRINQTQLNQLHNMFLDIEDIDYKYKSLVENCSLMIVAKVKAILHKKNINNQQPHLKLNEKYIHVQIETPHFILGIEDDNQSIIKNYIDIHNQLE